MVNSLHRFLIAGMLLTSLVCAQATEDTLRINLFKRQTSTLKTLFQTMMLDEQKEMESQNQAETKRINRPKPRPASRLLLRNSTNSLTKWGFWLIFPGCINPCRGHQRGDYDAKLYIRGGNSNETILLLDGQVINYPFIWMAGGL